MNVELNIEFFEEDGNIIAVCPDLEVSSFGETVEEAERSIKEALELFFEGCEIQNSTYDVLEETGFQYINGTWVPRKPIKAKTTTIHPTTANVSNA